MNPPNQKNPATQSMFVSVLAWIFIVLAGFATVISVFQNIMVHTVLTPDRMQMVMTEVKSKQEIPPYAEFMLENFRPIMLLLLIVSAATFVSAIGLLKRKNWARVVFIWLLGFGILWQIGGLIMQQSMMSSMSAAPPNTQPEFQSQFETMATMMLILSFAMAIGLSLLFGWIIKRLMSPTIQQEFA